MGLMVTNGHQRTSRWGKASDNRIICEDQD